MQPAANSGQALQQLQSYQQSMKNPADLMTASQNKYGVSGAQQQVSGLRQAITNTTNLLSQIPQGVMGRAQNSLVTQGQANRQIQNEQAPVAENLNRQSQDYGQASSDLERAMQQSGQEANLEQQGQSMQMAALKNIYDTMYGREQDDLQRQAQAAAEAERIREFNTQMDAAKRGSGGGGGIGGLGSLGGGGGGGGQSASMSQRGDKGYNFTDASGRSISAAQYSQLKGVPFRDLLSEMANHGDAGARSALGFVGNDYGYDSRKLVPGISSPQMMNLYKSLVWR